MAKQVFFNSISKVHRYLKCDGRDAFNVTEDQFMEFVDIEVLLQCLQLQIA